jgi:hypothetical protein
MEFLFSEDDGHSECDHVEKMPKDFTVDIDGFVDSELSEFTGMREFVRSGDDGRSKSTRWISRIGDDLTKLDGSVRGDTGVQRNKPRSLIALKELAKEGDWTKYHLLEQTNASCLF